MPRDVCFRCRHGRNEAEVSTLNSSEHIEARSGWRVYKRAATHRGAQRVYIFTLNYLHRLSYPIVDVRRVARLANTTAGGVHGPIIDSPSDDCDLRKRDRDRRRWSSTLVDTHGPGASGIRRQRQQRGARKRPRGPRVHRSPRIGLSLATVAIPVEAVAGRRIGNRAQDSND